MNIVENNRTFKLVMNIYSKNIQPLLICEFRIFFIAELFEREITTVAFTTDIILPTLYLRYFCHIFSRLYSSLYSDVSQLHYFFL